MDPQRYIKYLINKSHILNQCVYLYRCKEGRNTVAHGNKPAIFHCGMQYLQEWKKLVGFIKDTNTEKQIADIINKLSCGLTPDMLELLLTDITIKSVYKQPNANQRPILSDDDKRGLDICAGLGDVITSIFSPAIYKFSSASKGFTHLAFNYDLYGYLKQLIKKYACDPTILQIPEGIPDDLKSQLALALEGRNHVEHLILSDMELNWEPYLRSWYWICLAIKDEESAKNIATYLKLYVGNKNINNNIADFSKDISSVAQNSAQTDSPQTG